VDEHDRFSEWTEPHPAELEDNGQHCVGGRTCIRCDPGDTGQQTVNVSRARQSWDWFFIESEVS
jgi:hypothetical protein